MHGPGDVRVEYGPHAVVIIGRMSSAEKYKGHDQLILAWPRFQIEGISRPFTR